MKKNDNKNTRKGNPMLWLASGIYLVYLAYDMINQVIKDPAMDNKLFFAAAAVFFGLFGLALVVISYRRYNADKQGPSQSPEDEAVSEDGELEGEEE